MTCDINNTLDYVFVPADNFFSLAQMCKNSL